MKNYFEMLVAKADTLGVRLIDVAQEIGIARTTVLRWQHGHTSPRHGTAVQINRELDRLGILLKRSQSADLAPARPRPRR